LSSCGIAAQKIGAGENISQQPHAARAQTRHMLRTARLHRANVVGHITYNKGHSMSPHILKLIEAVTIQDPKTLHEIRMNELAEKALKEMESLEAKTYTSADNVAP